MHDQSTYECRYTPESPRIDGHLWTPVWEKAPELEFRIPVTNATPQGAAIGRLLWDDRYLYAAIQAFDKDIWGYFTERDSATCNEDVLELFIKPRHDSPAYFNFEINALGTVYDAFNVKRAAGGEDHHRWKVWNCEGLRVGVEVKGTLNDWEDVDEYWCLELAVPFAGLPLLRGRTPDPGDTWMFHLARYDYSVYLEEGMELSSTTTFKSKTGSFFHRYEDWQTLKFVK